MLMSLQRAYTAVHDMFVCNLHHLFIDLRRIWHLILQEYRRICVVVASCTLEISSIFEKE
jgi:hypothetical protein